MHSIEVTSPKIYILMSESRIGIHKHKNNKEEFIVIPGTFIPNFSNTEGWNYSGEIFQKAIINSEIYKAKGCEVNFLIGYDLDENGEFMSSVLRQELIKTGIASSKIFRTPLTENGYITITEFIDIDKYIAFRTLDVIFQRTCQRETGRKLGILKALALYFLQKNKGKTFKVKQSGISTSTVVYKHLNKEKRTRAWI